MQCFHASTTLSTGRHARDVRKGCPVEPRAAGVYNPRVMPSKMRSTTIVSCRRDGAVAIGGDGQVTFGQTRMKGTARKIYRLAEGKVLAGVAGGTADAMALLDRFEGILGERRSLRRAAIELAKLWRTDRILRRLEAFLAVVDAETSLVISGAGDVLEPDDGVIGLGSGGPFAMAAARALLAHTTLAAPEVVRESLRIAAGICIYTNTEFIVETLP